MTPEDRLANIAEIDEGDIDIKTVSGASIS